MTPGRGPYRRPRGGRRPRPPGSRVPFPPAWFRDRLAATVRALARGPAPPAWLAALLAAGVVLVVVAGVGLWWVAVVRLRDRRPPAPPAATGRSDYLLCSWNVENLFDDEDDPNDHDADEDWFGRNPSAVGEKVELLAQALVLQNGGRGPDIVVLVEVESRRAAALLRDALNDRLAATDRYTALVFRENKVGRRVAPAVLARLPVRDDLTRSFPSLRVLEAHLVGPGGAPLVVIACHWTSRLRGTGDSRRAVYAATVYGAVAERIAADPAADVLVAGDFNDGPDDPSVVDGLHAVADPALVVESARSGGPPRLLDLTARLDPDRDGTYRYRGRWEVFDHLVASPGLLDPAGWRVRPETVRTEHAPPLRDGADGRPRRFGPRTNPRPRGPSDHFAVSVRLEVGAPTSARRLQPDTATP